MGARATPVPGGRAPAARAAAAARPAVVGALSTRAWTLVTAAVFLVLSLAYVVAVPPFEAPDENSHYEYARLLADLGRVPGPEDRSPALFSRVEQYMLAHRLGLVVPQRGLVFNPELGRQPATYYFLPAAIARIAPDDLAVQVRAMRLASVALGLATVLVVAATAAELFPPGSFARLSLPLGVALMPGYLFISAVLNNDNLANLGGALVFWGLARAMRRGVRPLALLLVLVGLVVGLTAKRTALAALPAVPVILYGAWVLRRSWPPVTRATALLAPLLLLATYPSWALVRTDHPGTWQPSALGVASRVPDGLFGASALRVSPPSELDAGSVSQQVASQPPAEGITVGFWARSADDRPGRARVDIDSGGQVASVVVDTSDVWRFAHRSFQPGGRAPVVLRLTALPGGAPVLFDGVAAAPGRLDGVPDAPDGRRGVWDGRSFANLVANGSGEDADQEIAPWLHRPLEHFGLSPDVVLATASVGRLAVIGWEPTYDRLAFFREGYVGRFGWMGIPMPDAAYLGFDLLAGLGAAGLLALAARAALVPHGRSAAGVAHLASAALGRGRRESVESDPIGPAVDADAEALPLAAHADAAPASLFRPDLAIAGAWLVAALGAFVVSLLPFLVGARFAEWPQGRFLYPALVPINGLVVLGLGQFVPRAHARTAALVFLALGVALNVYVLLGTIVPYYPYR